MAADIVGSSGFSEFTWPFLEEVRCGSSNYGYTTTGFLNSTGCAGFFDTQTCALYDGDKSVPPDVDYFAWPDRWFAKDIIDTINSGVHIINHLGDGDYAQGLGINTATYDLSKKLTNTDYFFAYSQSCMSGGFDNPGCFAQGITAGAGAGAVGAVMNARNGWFIYGGSLDSPSQRFNRMFWDTFWAVE